MRKHLYLITEHERREEFVGNVKFTDSRLSTGCKNEETPILTLDEDARDFSTVGKQVHMGYVDFDGDGELTTEQAMSAIDKKLQEIDERHLSKAGITQTSEVDK